MIGELSQYLTQAPLAVIVLAYMFFNDRQKNKIIKSMQDQNKDLLNTINSLSERLTK